MNPAPGPFQPGILNTNFTPLFHRRTFDAAGAMGTEVTFFGETAGVAGVGPETTNMSRAFELEAPRRFTVTALSIATYDSDDADVYKVMKGYTCQLMVGGTLQLNAPIDFWPAASGLYNGGFNNGMPDPQARQTIMPHPIEIPSGVGFLVRLVGTSQTPTAAMFIGIYLVGPYSRPVG